MKNNRRNLETKNEIGLDIWKLLGISEIGGLATFFARFTRLFAHFPTVQFSNYEFFFQHFHIFCGKFL